MSSHTNLKMIHQVMYYLQDKNPLIFYEYLFYLHFDKVQFSPANATWMKTFQRGLKYDSESQTTTINLSAVNGVTNL